MVRKPSKKNSPIQRDDPRRFNAPSQKAYPEFKVDQLDNHEKWGFHQLDFLHIKTIFQKIFQFQKMTWQELEYHGSHLVSIKKLCHHARERLEEIGNEDVDELFSLRFSGKERLWGIKDRNVFWILWWDPNHEICSSNKKHT